MSHKRSAASGGIDYAGALREAGFDPEGIARGLRMIESGLYLGFADVMVSLSIEGAVSGARQHTRDDVARRVSAQEARAAISERGAAAGLRVAAREAQEAEDRTAHMRELIGQARLLAELRSQMTDDEYEGRVPLRPALAAALERLDRPLRAAPSDAVAPLTEAAQGQAWVDGR
jgi:hypothetical protein